jgi:HSP20 family protein
MNIVRWNPAFDVLNMHSELDRVFNDLVRGAGMVQGGQGSQAFLPIDVLRRDNDVVIEASVPGFKPEQVEVTVDHDTLTISARRDSVEKDGDTRYIRQERALTSLYRQVSLGQELDGDRAQASFDHGVLTITIPTVARPEPKKIPVALTTEARTEG